MRKIFSVLAAALIVAIGAGMSGCASEDTIEEIQTEAPADSVGGMVISADEDEKKKSGITFTKKAIPLSDYEENGISAQAESAYTVMATVTADDPNADNTEIEWSAAFQGAWSDRFDASPGQGHFVYLNECITVTPSRSGAAGSKTVAVACLQGFSAPIVLTAKCKYAPEIQASVQIDYAPKITGIMQDYYGQMSGLSVTNNHTTTTISKFNLNSGKSGLPYFSSTYLFNYSSCYTLEDTFTVRIVSTNGRKFNVISDAVWVESRYTTMASGSFTLTESDRSRYMYGKQVKLSISYGYGVGGSELENYCPFNATMLDVLNIQYCHPTGEKISSSTALADRLNYFSPYLGNANFGFISNVTLCDLQFNIAGTYSSTELVTTLCVTQFVNEA